MGRACQGCLLENGSVGVLIIVPCAVAMTLAIPAMCLEQVAYWILRVAV